MSKAAMMLQGPQQPQQAQELKRLKGLSRSGTSRCNNRQLSMLSAQSNQFREIHWNLRCWQEFPNPLLLQSHQRLHTVLVESGRYCEYSMIQYVYICVVSISSTGCLGFNSLITDYSLDLFNILQAAGDPELEEQT